MVGESSSLAVATLTRCSLPFQKMIAFNLARIVALSTMLFIPLSSATPIPVPENPVGNFLNTPQIGDGIATVFLRRQGLPEWQGELPVWLRPTAAPVSTGDSMDWDSPGGY